jgi:hypothetical protein
VAGALAAGVISSQAQVYSQNIVGYVNNSTPNGGTYAVEVPFKVGVSNGANEVWPLVGGLPTIPDFSEILIWNGTGYTAFFSDSGSPSLWDDGSQTPINNSPVLPVGQGFFLIPSASTTNSFVGTVAVNVGTSNNMVLPNGGTYFVAPAVPYGGSVTNGTSSGGGPALSSLNNLPDFSELLIWTGTGYTAYFSDSGSPSLWDDGSQTPIANAPTITVGQSFFLIPSANFTWTVGL